MNYRHAYHAGNFADVLKHAILARVITYLKLKPQPFRVIDTHAGAGRYDLKGVEAGKTGEWRDGIERLRGATLPAAAAELLQPYLDAVAFYNSGSTSTGLSFYPGSPLIARHLMRTGDQLVVNELHPDDAGLLKSEFHKAPATKVMQLDAWQAVKALLPPKERRGLILMDPPFEHADEFQRLAAGLDEGLRRFETGTFLVWYPVKDRDAADQLVEAVLRRPKVTYLDARLVTSHAFPGLGLTEAGVLAVNPPYTLRRDLEIIGPVLAHVLAEGPGAAFHLNGSPET